LYSASHCILTILCCNMKLYLHFWFTSFHLLLYAFNMSHGIFCHCSMRTFHCRFVTSDSLNRTVCRGGKYTNISTMYKDTFYSLPMVAVYISIPISFIVLLSSSDAGWLACQFEWRLWIYLARLQQRAETYLWVPMQPTGRLESYQNCRCEIWGSFRGDYEKCYPPGCNASNSDRRSPCFKETYFCLLQNWNVNEASCSKKTETKCSSKTSKSTYTA
jgi:hypothetical protein